MRVLFISDVYFPRVNGVSTSIRTFREDLAFCGVETRLICPIYDAELIGDKDNGVKRVASSRVPRDPEDRRMRIASLRNTLNAFEAGSFDLVHIHTPFVAHYAGVRFARDRCIPCIATYHTFFEEYLHHYIPVLPRAAGRWLARAFTRSQCRDLDGLIAPSGAMRDALAAYRVATPVTVIPTGLPQGRFKQGDADRFRRKFRIDVAQPVLLYLGRVAFEKNIELLIRMLPEVLSQQPAALLVIAGEGPAQASLRKLVEELHLTDSVQFVGYLDRDTSLLDCYAAANIFVFASKTETQGLVLLEAMAQGTPVVASAALGTVSILAPERGAVVVADKPEAFAKAIVDLLRDPVRLAQLSADGREYAQTWSSRTMAERLATLYAETIAARHSAPRQLWI